MLVVLAHLPFLHSKLIVFCVYFKKVTKMTSQFLNFYVSNLEMFSFELYRNQKSIQELSDNIKAITLEVQQKLKQLSDEMIIKQRLSETPAEQIADIKVIYLLMKQTQKYEAEKRSLTRKACDIVDKYLASFDKKVKSATSHHLNAEDHGDDLIQTLLTIKLQMNQPVHGNAVIIDLIKKMENERANTSGESNATLLDDVNKNIEVFSSVRRLKNLHLDDMANEASASNCIHRMDSLQGFTEKVMDTCSEIRSRYKIEEPTNSDSDILTNNDDENSTDEDVELCHCRSHDIGQMVACDNTGCKIKWYHFECVGLYKTPEGAWYCPSCLIFENI